MAKLAEPKRFILPDGQEARISFRKRPKFEGEWVDGYCQKTPPLLIVIGTEAQSLSQQASTLLHEILHFLTPPPAGTKPEEQEVERWSMLLTSVIQRNRGIFEWIVRNL